MPCIWNNVDYTVPPTRVKLLVKYNPFRSDTPFQYVVAHFDMSWRTHYMSSDGRVVEGIIPKPDWWSLIEAEDDHG